MRLFQLLKNIITTLNNSIAKKQNKTWVKLGTATTGTLNISTISYTELKMFVEFGGVQVSQTIPVSMLTTSAQIFMPGHYGNGIYVNITKTTAKISQHPAGYTGKLTVYAR